MRPTERDAVAWLDVSAGVSGDMLLGAFVDAGVDLGAVQRHVDAVLPGTVRLERSEVLRAGTRATKVDVRLLTGDQPHRSWTDIRTLLGGAHPAVRDRAVAVLGRLASIEGRIHGVATDDVHFHEIGSWDSIADVVGVCAAAVELGVAEIVASPIALGSGRVRTAHGELAVPVPAVLGLVSGWSVTEGGAGELATPTGVALVVELATGQGPLPDMTVGGHGVGAGTRDMDGRANVVRLVVGRRGPERRDMVVLESNVDDLDPRVWPTVLDALLTAGAADAWLAPILMKKGRPAHTLAVLCGPSDAERLRALVFDLTSTIGVRETPVARWALSRGWSDVDVDGRPVAVKVAHRGGAIVHATPEFEDAVAAATQLGRPVRDILAAAAAAGAAAGLVRGATRPEGLRDRR
jgi:pyridinium-3,5-bisthiocarboxylic acid mononucleotide nickel chelatase